MGRPKLHHLALCLLVAAQALAGGSADHAIGELVYALETGTPEAIKSIAIWQWQDEKLPEPVQRAFRDDLEIALIQSARFQYFHRERFRQILRERQLTLARLLDPAAMKAAAAAGINAFLSIEVVDAAVAHPELKDHDTHTVLLAKLTDAATAAVVWAGYIEGTNQPVLRNLLGNTKPKDGQTRYRQVAAAIAAGLKASGLAEAEIKTITLSSPPKDAEPDTGIGIRNPDDAPFDLEAFQDELLLAVVGSQAHAYVDPAHIGRLVAQWKADSDAAAAANTQALAQSFALDGYLFGEIRSSDADALELSMRLVSLKDGSEAWAGKFRGIDTLGRIEPREVPQPPAPRAEPPPPAELTLEDIELPLKPPVPMPELLPLPEGPPPPKGVNPVLALLYLPIGLPRDALDTTFHAADRVPLVGAVTSGLYRYGGIAHLCRLGTGEAFMQPVLSHEALSYGQLHSPARWSLLPNAHSWGLAPRDDHETIRAYAAELDRVRTDNEKRLTDWRTAEQARKKHNDDALTTLRSRNAAQLRAWEQTAARVRRDNATAQQRFERDKAAIDEHNLRAARINRVTSSVYRLTDALAPRKARPRYVPPKPEPPPANPKPAPPKPDPPAAGPKPPVIGPKPPVVAPRPRPRPMPKPLLKPNWPAVDPPPLPAPKPAPKPVPKPIAKPAPAPLPGPPAEQ